MTHKQRHATQPHYIINWVNRPITRLACEIDSATVVDEQISNAQGGTCFNRQLLCQTSIMKRGNKVGTTGIAFAVLCALVGFVIGMTYANSDVRRFCAALLFSVRVTDKNGATSWPFEKWAQTNLAPLETKPPPAVYPQSR